MSKSSNGLNLREILMVRGAFLPLIVFVSPDTVALRRLTEMAHSGKSSSDACLLG